MLINGKPFNPGDLKTKIVLARRTITKDTGGFQKAGYSYIGEVFSKWINVHGQEVWAADARGATKPASVTIRYKAGLDNTCVVIKAATVTPVEGDDETTYTITGGEVYEIVSMDNIQEINEYIELKVQLTAAG